MFEEMAFLLPMVIACFGLGFAFQGLVTERESVFVCWVITSVVFLFLSGMIWPRYDMAPVWKALSDICPRHGSGGIHQDEQQRVEPGSR